MIKLALLLTILGGAVTINAQCPHPIVNSVSPPILTSTPTVVAGTILVQLDITPVAPCNFVGVNLWYEHVIFPSGHGCVIGEPGNSCIGQDITPPYAILVDTAWMSNGLHDLRIDVYDQYDDSFGAPIHLDVENPAPLPDTQPPQVCIQSPGDGNLLGNGPDAQVEIVSSVADNVGVVQVDLLVNGVLSQVSTTAPYSFIFKPKKRGTYQIQLRAWDNSANSALSNIVNVIK